MHCPICSAPLRECVQRHIDACMTIEAHAAMGAGRSRRVQMPRNPDDLPGQAEEKRPFPFSR